MLDLVSQTYLSNKLLHSLSEALQRKKSDENNKCNYKSNLI